MHKWKYTHMFQPRVGLPRGRLFYLAFLFSAIHCCAIQWYTVHPTIFCMISIQGWLNYFIINLKSLLVHLYQPRVDWFCQQSVMLIMYDINPVLTKLLYDHPLVFARDFVSTQSWQILPEQSFLTMLLIWNQGWLKYCIINP